MDVIKFIGIIPARYDSTRFPGKPLVDINGKTMIQRVYEQSSLVLENVFVATDDSRIEAEVKKFRGKVVLTSKEHKSGTDRCQEAISIIEKEQNTAFNVIINIQGDEPFINPKQIELIKSIFNKSDSQIATLVKKLNNEQEINNPNVVKVIFDKNLKAIYFSRFPIPYNRTNHNVNFFKHIGIYAYKRDILKEITKLNQSDLEISESLEQLRWIENGYKISVRETDCESIAIDSPEDLKKL